MLFTDDMPEDQAEGEGMLGAAVPSLHLHLDNETQSLLDPFPLDADEFLPEQPPAEVCCTPSDLRQPFISVMAGIKLL